jgi:hypothetical protein
MSRTPSAFRQQDVTRALRGADAAGRPVRRVEIGPDGKIVLVMIENEAGLAEPKPERSADQIVL